MHMPHHTNTDTADDVCATIATGSFACLLVWQEDGPAESLVPIRRTNAALEEDLALSPRLVLQLLSAPTGLALHVADYPD